MGKQWWSKYLEMLQSSWLWFDWRYPLVVGLIYDPGHLWPVCPRMTWSQAAVYALTSSLLDSLLTSSLLKLHSTGEKKANAASVIMPPQIQMLWGNTWQYTMEKSCTCSWLNSHIHKICWAGIPTLCLALVSSSCSCTGKDHPSYLCALYLVCAHERTTPSYSYLLFLPGVCSKKPADPPPSEKVIMRKVANVKSI